jgi:hypothetical protein
MSAMNLMTVKRWKVSRTFFAFPAHTGMTGKDSD